MSAALALLFQGLLALQPPATLPAHGIYGSQTTALDAAYFSPQPVSVTSPNGESTAVASHDDDRDTFAIEVSGALGEGRFQVASGPNQEMMWSPDSKALFVTADNGGTVGTYELTVVGLNHGRLVRRDLSPWLARLFGHPVRCFDPETPNVAGVTWIGDAHHLLVAVQIQRHSNCDGMGGFKTYEIDPFQPRLLARYGQIESKRRFASALGPALMSADDTCAIRPRACWVPQLHAAKSPRLPH